LTLREGVEEVAEELNPLFVVELLAQISCQFRASMPPTVEAVLDAGVS
jgi:hypothetical protein